MLVHGFLTCLFHPVILIAFVFLAGPVFQAMGIKTTIDVVGSTNCTRLVVWTYLVAAPVLYVVLFGAQYGFLRLLGANLSLEDFIVPTSLFWTYVPFVATILTLMVYISPDGMEGNIMGFIFFPMLLVSTFYIGVRHVYWLWTVVVPTMEQL